MIKTKAAGPCRDQKAESTGIKPRTNEPKHKCKARGNKPGYKMGAEGQKARMQEEGRRDIADVPNYQPASGSIILLFMIA